MKEKCPRCQGKGWDELVCYSERCYKVICAKCYGKKKLDWIEMITKVKDYTGPLQIVKIMSKLQKDDYLLEVPGASYFIYKGFFNPHLSYTEQFKYLRMIVTWNYGGCSYCRAVNSVS